LNKDLVNGTVAPVGEHDSDRDVDRLRLLASAIAGSPLEVADAGPGERAWTDGTTVFVDAHAAPADQVGMVAVQASLLAAGSLAPEVVRRLQRRPALARRYLAVEGPRALAANEDLLPGAVRTLVDRRPEVVGADGPVESLALARVRRAHPPPPEVLGTVRPGHLLAALERTGATASASAAASGDDRRPPPTTPLPSLDDLDEADLDDPHGLGRLPANPVGGGGPIGRLLQRLLSPARSPGGGGPVGADTPTHQGQAGGHGRGRATTAFANPDTREPVDPANPFGPRNTTYPEWDAGRRRYRPGWCTVSERDPRPADLAPMALPDCRALRRPLARLGRGLARTHRRPQGDEVDVDAAVEAWVDVRAGSPPDEAVYVESLRRRRDLAVLVLLDVSGSAGEAGTAGRTVHDHQREAAAAVATALHDLGDRVALYAFNSQGRRAVHVTRVKGFDDLLDGRVVRRLGGLAPGAYTRLGAAIRHGGSVLEEKGGTSRRLLLVLSDGFAYDHGYEGRYGEADARRALAEVRRRGTGCLCLSVGAGADPAALRRVFGTAAHATVPAADRLPGVVGPLVRTALASAEAQRRAHQRRVRTAVALDDARRT
jgi:nitric oxide reductase NorD protein